MTMFGNLIYCSVEMHLLIHWTDVLEGCISQCPRLMYWRDASLCYLRDAAVVVTIRQESSSVCHILYFVVESSMQPSSHEEPSTETAKRSESSFNHEESVSDRDFNFLTD